MGHSIGDGIIVAALAVAFLGWYYLPDRVLPRTGRWVLSLYAAAALLASVWVMRKAAIDWTLIVPAVVAPLIVVAATWRRRLGRMLGISVIM